MFKDMSKDSYLLTAGIAEHWPVQIIIKKICLKLLFDYRIYYKIFYNIF